MFNGGGGLHQLVEAADVRTRKPPRLSERGAKASKPKQEDGGGMGEGWRPGSTRSGEKGGGKRQGPS